jgi:hypothetical protein
MPELLEQRLRAILEVGLVLLECLHVGRDRQARRRLRSVGVPQHGDFMHMQEAQRRALFGRQFDPALEGLLGRLAAIDRDQDTLEHVFSLWSGRSR